MACSYRNVNGIARTDVVHKDAAHCGGYWSVTVEMQHNRFDVNNTLPWQLEVLLKLWLVTYWVWQYSGEGGPPRLLGDFMSGHQVSIGACVDIWPDRLGSLISCPDTLRICLDPMNILGGHRNPTVHLLTKEKITRQKKWWHLLPQCTKTQKHKNYWMDWGVTGKYQ